MHTPLRHLALIALSLSLAACSDSTAVTPPSQGGNPPPSPLTDVTVLTYHDDNARDGLNAKETVLTPANVEMGRFGKLGFMPVDGKVDAQPLYLPQMNIGGVKHDVLYVVTEHDSVYAFDADSGKQLWRVSLLLHGETTSDDRSCSQVEPEIGITSTPVIDPAAGPHGTLYVVAMSKNGSSYYQRLHAIDVITGAELADSPTTIQAKFPGSGDDSSGGFVHFDPAQYKERAGLLLVNGVIYLSWASHCDHRPYTGWVMGYAEQTLQQTSAFDITPNGNEAAVWAAGAGPAADSAGNIYFLAGNGTFETSLDSHGLPSQGDYGNAFMKLATTGNTLSVADYFDMASTLAESDADEDLGSGGAMLLPDLMDSTGHTRHLAVGAGKDLTIYVVDRDNMGKFDPSTDHIWQEIPNGLGGGEFGMPAYFNGTVYYGAVGDVVRAFSINKAKLSALPSSQTSRSFDYPGATPSISANGSKYGIVWVTENGTVAGLYAYDATNLGHELYDSNQAGSRDQFGKGNKFITPTIVNGKVYVATTDGVAIFGLLH